MGIETFPQYAYESPSLLSRMAAVEDYGDWTDWTPSTPNLSQGNGTLTARYTQIGKTVSFIITFQLGSTSVVYTGPRFSLPVTPSGSGFEFIQAQYGDYGSATYGGLGQIVGSEVYLYAYNAAGTYLSASGIPTTNVPFTWNTNDLFMVRGTYEAATSANTGTPSLSRYQNNDPVGSVSIFAGSSAPTGWLMCDGSAISRVTYADLFEVVGTTYGTGDGSTTFNLPNLKGKVPVGYDSGQTEFDALGETGGAKTHTLTEAEMPSHSHSGLASNYSPGSENVGPVVQWININESVRITSTGGGGAHNNLQPYIAMNYIIRSD